MDARTIEPLEKDAVAVVIGLGFVGLPLAALLASEGYTVRGVDTDEAVAAALNAGQSRVDEPDLRKLLAHPACRTHLRAGATMHAGKFYIIAVPTPLDARKKLADLSAVDAAVTAILPHLSAGDCIIMESTVPPMTCHERIAPRLAAAGFTPGEDVHLAHCPERILPGNVVQELVHNDRIIGGYSPASARRAAQLYRAVVHGEIHLTDDRTAELCKLMENTSRDVNIALANEFAAVAGELGVDPMRAIELANKHPRVHILRPGIGVGGHCIPLDPWFIKELSPENSKLVFTARQVNDAMPARIAAKIRRAVCDVAEPRILAVGLAYKPDAKDTRESPALEIVRLLKLDGYEVDAWDPLLDPETAGPLTERARGADALAMLVEHSALKADLEANQDAIRAAMRTPIILRFP